MSKYRTKEWAQEQAIQLAKEVSVKHTYSSLVEAIMKFGTAYGATNITLTQEDIDALSQGQTIAYTDGEYHHFINMEN